MVRIGIDIGGTTIKGALIDSKNRIIKRCETATQAEKGRDVVLKNIGKIYSELKGRGGVSGVGVSFPGVIDKRGVVIDAPHIPSLKKVNLKKIFPREKVLFENDVNCFAYGELLLGAGKGMRTIVCLVIGTGVGAGIIIDRKIYEGTGGAGEFGHDATMNGIRRRKIAPGRSGDFDSEIGGEGIMKEYRRLNKEGINGLMAGDIFSLNNRVARKITEDVCMNTGLLISHIINALAPEAVIIGGGIGQRLPMAKVKRYARIFSFPPLHARCRILKSKLKNNAGIIGAAFLVDKT